MWPLRALALNLRKRRFFKLRILASINYIYSVFSMIMLFSLGLLHVLLSNNALFRKTIEYFVYQTSE